MANERPAKSRIRMRGGKGAPPSVDGHQGWVQQSVRQYATACSLVIGVHGFLVGAGPVLLGARSAAWWCVALGLMGGGILLWLPVYGIMHGKNVPVTSLPEAFVEAYGRIGGGVLSIFFALLATFDAIVAVRAVGSLVGQSLIFHSNEVLLTVSALGAATLVVLRHGSRGVSRFMWIARKLILVSLATCYVIMLSNASVNNLFPIIGYSAGDSLYALAYAASGCGGILLMGLLPQQTGSARRVRFSTGARVLLIGIAAAVLMVFLVNLCTPPRAVVRDTVWGHQVMLPAEYISQRGFRLIYICALSLAMVIVVGVCLSAGALLIQDAVGAKKGKWCVLPLTAIAIGMAFPTDQAFSQGIIAFMLYRTPLAMLPVWITWGVLLVRRGRKKGGMAA